MIKIRIGWRNKEPDWFANNALIYQFVIGMFLRSNTRDPSSLFGSDADVMALMGLSARRSFKINSQLTWTSLHAGRLVEKAVLYETLLLGEDRNGLHLSNADTLRVERCSGQGQFRT